MKKKDPRGRKPKKDKKIADTIYVPKSIVDQNGGLQSLKDKILVAVELGEL